MRESFSFCIIDKSARKKLNQCMDILWYNNGYTYVLVSIVRKLIFIL